MINLLPYLKSNFGIYAYTLLKYFHKAYSKQG